MIRPALVEGVEISIEAGRCCFCALTPEAAVESLRDRLVDGSDAHACAGCVERMNTTVVRMLAGGVS